jgi:predicted YcjX-like family ATPase
VDPLAAARAFWPGRQVVRVGVTGLARSGKTVLLTSLAANLQAAASGVPALPALRERLAGRSIRVRLAPSGAESMPRFDYTTHLAALAADPPHWPARTDAVSLLALDVDVDHAGAAAMLPPRRLRLQLLDYPGEWLLDLPLLRQGFAEWSAATLERLARHPQAGGFLAFAANLPRGAGADETLARQGHVLYARALRHLRDEVGLSLLQPGRFLMPPPGPPPPWLGFFPLAGSSPLAGLLARRYDAYREAVRRELLAPGLGRLDRLVVLADVLSALHAGPAAFAEAAEALGAVAATLRGRRAWWDALAPLLAALWPAMAGVQRVAYCASKSDHVASRQRGNLAALVRDMTRAADRAAEQTFAIAAARCTEDVVWTLEGRPISAVRGRVGTEGRAGRSYPGEVPDRIPGPESEFWTHPFLSLPDFEPIRVPAGGLGGIPHLELDALLLFLLDDLL